MNPFNNRWLALFMIVGFLLVVAELVGTGDHGGLLSQAAKSHAAGEQAGGADMEASPPRAIERPIVIDDVPPDVPEEDLPQIIAQDDVEDSSDLSAVDFPEPEMAADSPIEDEPGEE